MALSSKAFKAVTKWDCLLNASIECCRNSKVHDLQFFQYASEPNFFLNTRRWVVPFQLCMELVSFLRCFLKLHAFYRLQIACYNLEIWVLPEMGFQKISIGVKNSLRCFNLILCVLLGTLFAAWDVSKNCMYTTGYKWLATIPKFENPPEMRYLNNYKRSERPKMSAHSYSLYFTNRNLLIKH